MRSLRNCDKTVAGKISFQTRCKSANRNRRQPSGSHRNRLFRKRVSSTFFRYIWGFNVSKKKINFEVKGKNILFSMDGKDVLILVQGVVQSTGAVLPGG